jgi:hypothetical protein
MDEYNSYRNEEVNPQVPPAGYERFPVYDAKKIEAIEKRTKLILVLLICTLALGAVSLVFQFVSPFAGRGIMPNGNFPTSGGPGFAQQGTDYESAPAEENVQ